MSASTLWTSVTSAYDAAGLITLTNIRDRSAASIDTTAGESAAQEVIDLWPIYAQETFDATDSTHLAVGRRATIAVLWQRGGTATQIAKVEWDEVFGDDGMISKVKRTGPRARAGPTTNSGIQQSSERTTSGERVRGWSDPAALPDGRGFLPGRVIAED